MEYSCSECNYVSELNYNVAKHIKICGENAKILVEDTGKVVICEYCKHTYNSNRNYKRHLKICKVKIEKEKEKEPKREEINEINEVLEKNLKELKLLNEFNLKLIKENEELKEQINEVLDEIIYIIKEREHVRMKENVYKVGRTKQKFLKRFAAYPPGSQVFMVFNVRNSLKIENTIKKLFKTKYKLVRGTEYFEGDVSNMITDIINIINPKN